MDGRHTKSYSVVLVVILYLFPLAAFGSKLSRGGFQQTVRNLRLVPEFEAPNHITETSRRIKNSIDDDAKQRSKDERISVSGVLKTTAKSRALSSESANPEKSNWLGPRAQSIRVARQKWWPMLLIFDMFSYFSMR
jgi:hypothetical protein